MNTILFRAPHRYSLFFHHGALMHSAAVPHRDVVRFELFPGTDRPHSLSHFGRIAAFPFVELGDRPRIRFRQTIRQSPPPHVGSWNDNPWEQTIVINLGAIKMIDDVTMRRTGLVCNINRADLLLRVGPSGFVRSVTPTPSAVHFLDHVFLQRKEPERRCAICFEPLYRRMEAAPCPQCKTTDLHQFCLSQWMATNKSCPLCRYSAAPLAEPSEWGFSVWRRIRPIPFERRSLHPHHEAPDLEQQFPDIPDQVVPEPTLGLNELFRDNDDILELVRSWPAIELELDQNPDFLAMWRELAVEDDDVPELVDTWEPTLGLTELFDGDEMPELVD